MKKKKNKKKVYILAGIVLCIIISTITLLLFVPKKSMKHTKEKPSDNPYNTNLENDLFAKAMIYVASEYKYTTDEYNIDPVETETGYNVSVKTRDGEDVKEINIEIAELKKWEPNNASPEGTKELNGNVSNIFGSTYSAEYNGETSSGNSDGNSNGN